MARKPSSYTGGVVYWHCQDCGHVGHEDDFDGDRGPRCPKCGSADEVFFVGDGEDYFEKVAFRRAGCTVPAIQKYAVGKLLKSLTDADVEALGLTPVRHEREWLEGELRRLEAGLPKKGTKK